jgi:hypothetical protein
MEIFDWLFGKKKKDKNSEIKGAGAVYCALEIPFRPHQCPNCKNYLHEIERCDAFKQPTPPAGEMLAMFTGESQEDCTRFETLPKLNVQELIENEDVQGLMQAIQYGNGDMQSAASAGLIKIGEPAVESLILALKNVNPEVRLTAVYDLGAIGDVRAVEPLGNIITTDPNRDVRWHAVDALGKIGDVRALKQLTQALDDRDIYVRGAAKESVGKIKAKEYFK